jgi:peptide/nickel transport system substrate-binding protein
MEDSTGPQYGGTMTTAPHYLQGSIDPRVTHHYRSAHHEQVYDRLANLDWARGPLGTNELPYAAPIATPGDMTGNIAESWEQTDLVTVVAKIRQGIFWHDKAPEFGSELDAFDVADAFNDNASFEGAFFFYDNGSSAEATDKWNVTFTLPNPDFGWMESWLSRLFVVHPVEAVEEDGSYSDWKIQVGTGPFMIQDWVPDSVLTLEKNPNYWYDDPVAGHEGNRLPYLDKAIFLQIEDSGTKMAALETGKIDHQRLISPQLAEDVLARNPELKHRLLMATVIPRINLRQDFELDGKFPFQDERVRRALWLAIDNQAIKDDYNQGKAELFAYPFRPDVGIFKPLEEYSEAVQELYTYNPEKAKQLLADAGYPNGFKVESVNVQEVLELVQIVQAYWADIGVDLQINVEEQVAWQAMATAKEHPEVMISTGGSYPDPMAFFNDVRTDHGVNYSIGSNPKLDALFEDAASTLDRDAREKLVLEGAEIVAEEALTIQLPQAMIYNLWQPWLGGYEGVMDIYYLTWPKYAWIIEELK